MENTQGIETTPLYRFMLKAEAACRILAILSWSVFLVRLVTVWAGLV